MTDNSSLVIPGEASESDDEDYMSPIHKGASIDISGVSSGAPVDSDDDINITVSAFASRFEEANLNENPKYNTWFHKKLRESNWKLREEVRQFAKTSFTFASDQINEVNQKLLVSQVDTQGTVKSLRKSSIALGKMNAKLADCFSTPYIPPICIQ